MEDEFLLDDEGNPILDENGDPIPNENYKPPSGSTYEPDAEAKAWHDEQVAALTANRDKALRQLSTLRTKNEELETKNAELTTEMEGLRTAMQEGDFDAAELQAQKDKVKAQTAKIEELEADKASLLKQVEEQGLVSEVNRAVSSNILPEFQEFLTEKVRKAAKQGKEGRIYVYDELGEMLINDNAEPMTVAQYVSTTIREKHPSMFVKEVSKPTGGAQPPGTTPPANNPFHKDSINRTVQSTIIKNDPEKAKQMMRAAGYDAEKIARLTA